MSPTIVLADDHAIVRRGLRDLMYHYIRPKQLVEVTSCSDLLSAVAAVRPDLVVLDLELDDGNAMDLLEHMHDMYPDTRILVYTMSAERLYAQRVLSLGGAGFLSKQCTEDEVVKAVRRVLSGREYRSHEFEMKRLEQEGAEGLLKDPFKILSDREVRVMNELLNGASVKEIAERFGLQHSTVATYKARLFDKLGVSNLIDLKRLADAHRHG